MSHNPVLCYLWPLPAWVCMSIRLPMFSGCNDVASTVTAGDVWSRHVCLCGCVGVCGCVCVGVHVVNRVCWWLLWPTMSVSVSLCWAVRRLWQVNGTVSLRLCCWVDGWPLSDRSVYHCTAYWYQPSFDALCWKQKRKKAVDDNRLCPLPFPPLPSRTVHWCENTDRQRPYSVWTERIN